MYHYIPNGAMTFFSLSSGNRRENKTTKEQEDILSLSQVINQQKQPGLLPVTEIRSFLFLIL